MRIARCTIEIDTPQGKVKAVDKVSLTLAEGEIRGLVGESGSGKSLVAKVIVGIQKDNWTVRADRMRFNDMDLLTMAPRERRRIMGREIGQAPTVLVVSQPTWGVDAGAAGFIRQAMIDLVAEGAAIVVISQDLDELLEREAAARATTVQPPESESVQ